MKHLSCVLLTAALLLASGCSAAPRGPNMMDPDAPEEFSVTDSGLKYRILRRSEGKKPSPSDRVTVDYSGWLDNGAIFDSSYERRDSTSFGLSNVIPGWTEGMQLVGEGGMIELEVPPELGYGPRGQPPTIPPNATLHFKVELIRVH
ncbi:MAG: FKBP-type peptidyl-prolyl cis-trans isomerase [Rubripirellula sp.]